MISHRVFETAIGSCAVAWSASGVTATTLLVVDDADACKRLGITDPISDVAPPDWIETAIAELQAHLSGQTRPLREIPLDLSQATPFRQRVYATLRAEVPPGAVITYGDLATLVGNPNAARAVGSAMAHNPISLIIPCHRVVAAAGQLGGFTAAGSTNTKRLLLAIEGVTF